MCGTFRAEGVGRRAARRPWRICRWPHFRHGASPRPRPPFGPFRARFCALLRAFSAFNAFSAPVGDCFIFYFRRFFPPSVPVTNLRPATLRAGRRGLALRRRSSGTAPRGVRAAFRPRFAFTGTRGRRLSPFPEILGLKAPKSGLGGGRWGNRGAAPLRGGGEVGVTSLPARGVAAR